MFKVISLPAINFHKEPKSLVEIFTTSPFTQHKNTSLLHSLFGAPISLNNDFTYSFKRTNLSGKTINLLPKSFSKLPKSLSRFLRRLDSKGDPILTDQFLNNLVADWDLLFHSTHSSAVELKTIFFNLNPTLDNSLTPNLYIYNSNGETIAKFEKDYKYNDINAVHLIRNSDGSFSRIQFFELKKRLLTQNVKLSMSSKIILDRLRTQISENLNQDQFVTQSFYDLLNELDYRYINSYSSSTFSSTNLNSGLLLDLSIILNSKPYYSALFRNYETIRNESNVLLENLSININDPIELSKLSLQTHSISHFLKSLAVQTGCFLLPTLKLPTLLQLTAYIKLSSLSSTQTQLVSSIIPFIRLHSHFHFLFPAFQLIACSSYFLSPRFYHSKPLISPQSYEVVKNNKIKNYDTYQKHLSVITLLTQRFIQCVSLVTTSTYLYNNFQSNYESQLSGLNSFAINAIFTFGLFILDELVRKNNEFEILRQSLVLSFLASFVDTCNNEDYDSSILFSMFAYSLLFSLPSLFLKRQLSTSTDSFIFLNFQNLCNSYVLLTISTLLNRSNIQLFLKNIENFKLSMLVPSSSELYLLRSLFVLNPSSLYSNVNHFNYSELKFFPADCDDIVRQLNDTNISFNETYDYWSDCQNEITDAFPIKRVLTARAHPDKTGNTELFIKLNSLYENEPTMEEKLIMFRVMILQAVSVYLLLKLYANLRNSQAVHKTIALSAILMLSLMTNFCDFEV